NDVIDLAINSAIELIGHNIPGIYDEELWEHTFVTADVTNKVDNFPLPTNTKYIRSANFIDTTTAGQETFYPLLQISPDDAYDTDKIEGYRTGNIGYTTNTRDISATKQWNLNTFQRGGISTIGRSNRSGRPEFVYRHSWKIGDLLIMDNSCTSHYAVPDFYPNTREMHRIIITKGEYS
ncbi:MAG: hypothetical protein K1000chlam2_01226, partial [Chlamydiae bacterium]|nr:hypothetical protein [Chlamydiota bacterium]